MKRLGIYVLLIICIWACRQNKDIKKVENNNEKFLHSVLHNYNPMIELEKDLYKTSIDFLIEERFIKTPDEGFELMRIFQPSIQANLSDSEDPYWSFKREIQIGLEIIGNSPQDSIYYFQQLSDQSTYQMPQSLIERYNSRKESFSKIRLSRPLFNVNKNKAIIQFSYYCGDICGEGGRLVLEKESNIWKVKRFAIDWVS